MRVLVVGAGGHAKVVIDAIAASGDEIAGLVADPPHAAELLGLAVGDDVSSVPCDSFIVAIGDNAARARTYDRCLEAGLAPATVIHPSAVIAARSTIGPGTVVAAGAIVNIDAVIGANVILNTGCTVDHDCVVGDHALIGPTASLCGGVTVSEGALVGAGANVIPSGAVGAWSVVGAGAAVIEPVEAGTICAGVPARVIGTVEGSR